MTLPFAIVAAVLLATPAVAQSFCDLMPAAAVKAALGLTFDISAKPNTQGGNGCDYKSDAPGPTTVIADSSDDSGIIKTVFDQRIGSMKSGKGGQVVSGVGEVAYYGERNHQQTPSAPNQAFTQQSIVFRAKGKIVSFIVMTPGNGLPKAALLSLAKLAISKPIDTVKDPE